MADKVLLSRIGRRFGVARLNAAKTHCPRGHKYTPENTRWMLNRNKRVRRCKACESAYKKRSYAWRLIRAGNSGYMRKVRDRIKTIKPTKGLFGPI